MKYGRQVTFLHLKTDKFKKEVDYLQALLTEEDSAQ